MPTAKQLIGVTAVGVGLGLYALLRGKPNGVKQSLTDILTRASYTPAAQLSLALPVSITAVYRVGDLDEIQRMTLPSNASWSDVVLIAQRLASCVLLEPSPVAPTSLWSIRVSRGPVPLSSYQRPAGQALAPWTHAYGRSMGNMTTARPNCAAPFCTNDAARVAAGSQPCS
jgi:hypothetical protein